MHIINHMHKNAIHFGKYFKQKVRYFETFRAEFACAENKLYNGYIRMKKLITITDPKYI